MKKLLILLITMLLAFGTAGIAGATVIDFDDITSEDYAPIPSDYEGLNWNASFYVLSDEFFMNSYGNSYGSPSGDYAAFNFNGAQETTLASDADFNFIGAHFSTWAWQDGIGGAGSTSITVNGYNNGTFVDSVSMNLSTSYDWLNADLFGVDELVFTASGDIKFWLMDDLKIAPVPEPTTMLLLGSGLVGLAGLRKRKFK